MTLQPVETLLAAVLVLLLGHLLNRLIPPLAQYNIPAPITGGLLFALGLLLAGSSTGFSLEFDVTLRPVLLLSFFAAVGLSANLALLRAAALTCLALACSAALRMWLCSAAKSTPSAGHRARSLMRVSPVRRW